VSPNNCIEVPYASVLIVCTETEYVVTVDVAAVAPNTGIPCTGTDTIEFVSETSPHAPTLSPSRDVSSSQPTPVRGCPPTDPGCTPIPCTCDCECEALYPGETTGVCLCEPEDPNDCEFDHDGGDDDDGDDDADDDGGVGDDDDGGSGKKSGYGDIDDSKRRLTLNSGKKSGGDDDDDVGGGSTDGGGTDGLVFSANCCDCEYLEKPCSCQCSGYDDPVSPGQPEDRGVAMAMRTMVLVAKAKVVKEARAAVVKEARANALRQLLEDHDEDNWSHFRSRLASRDSSSILH
jgi:hypothetical protein